MGTRMHQSLALGFRITTAASGLASEIREY
jgi:hypothetical protein